MVMNGQVQCLRESPLKVSMVDYHVHGEVGRHVCWLGAFDFEVERSFNEQPGKSPWVSLASSPQVMQSLKFAL